MAINAIDDLMSEAGTKEAVPTNCEFITGAAGTGKTYLVKERFELDDSGILAATTGIAAVNLGTTTVNSVLGYFDTDDLADKYYTGRLTKKFSDLLEEGITTLGIDEISMMPAEQLDVMYLAAQEANQRSMEKQIKLLITGDFCQLPPVEGNWAFKADAWGEFAKNTTRLTKRWRQKDPVFLDALDAARMGRKDDAIEALKKTVEFRVQINDDFDGTTIVPTNALAERANNLRYIKLKGAEKEYKSTSWGMPRKEWRNIPDVLKLKVGVLVMILSNEPTTFRYVNGDLGTVTSLGATSISVKLQRTGEIVEIKYISRSNYSKDKPSNVWDGVSAWDRSSAKFDTVKQQYITGAINYLPVRLGYASTVHKTQGLTLDNVQIDIRNAFFGEPAMSYVALSRARTPEGVKIIGSPEMLKRRINFDPEVGLWV